MLHVLSMYIYLFSGVFSKLTIHVKLKRRFGFYILQVYAPCILVVMLSWLSFWMNPEDVGKSIETENQTDVRLLMQVVVVAW